MVFSGTVRPEWAIAVTLVTLGLWKLYRLGHRSSSLPPGPPTTPVLGNLLIMPQKYAFLQMTTWSGEYGEIFSLIGGPSGTIIVLTSPKAVYEILERQAVVTANRAQTVLVNSVFCGLTMGSSNYNPYWKATRRMAMEILKPKACNNHMPLVIAESRQLMFDTLRSPEDLYKHIQRVTISTMLSIIYGQRAPRFSSAFITNHYSLAQKMFATITLENTQALQMFPILRFLPERWATWKPACRALREDTRAMLFCLLDAANERLSKGQSNGCFLESILEMAKELGLSHLEICYFTWSMLNGGSTTITTWLHFFTLCITANPEVQAKAQAEIDTIIGNERVPEPKDIDSLPYVQAIIKEVSRFRPVVPMLLPHVATADVAYDKYHIPSGSVILANAWGIFRDEKLFEQPDTFDPERYLRSPFGLREGVDDQEEAFKRLNMLPWGCGRRACPGTYLAQQTIGINVMNLLWAFNFNKPRSTSGGAEMEIDLWGFTSSSIVDVLPFTVHVKERSVARAEIIEREYTASTEIFEKFERELDPEDLQYVNGMRSGLPNVSG